jgi:hypothetical protein
MLVQRLSGDAVRRIGDDQIDGVVRDMLPAAGNAILVEEEERAHFERNGIHAEIYQKEKKEATNVWLKNASTKTV